jgi:hypothetical protein
MLDFPHCIRSPQAPQVPVRHRYRGAGQAPLRCPGQAQYREASMLIDHSGGGNNVIGLTYAAAVDFPKWTCHGLSLSGIIVEVEDDMRPGAPPIDRVLVR